MSKMKAWLKFDPDSTFFEQFYFNPKNRSNKKYFKLSISVALINHLKLLYKADEVLQPSQVHWNPTAYSSKS